MRAAAPALLALAALVACAAGDATTSDARPKPAASAPAATASAPPPARRPVEGVVPAGLPRAAAFSAERAWKHLEAQVAMGPRANGMPGHAKLREALAAHLRACGAEVRTQEFTHVRHGASAPSSFQNVMGRFNPQAARWVLLGTHFDTRLWADVDPNPAHRETPIQGANDGGSGTAVLMEIATVLKEIPPEIGVEIVFFDGEDFGRPQHFDDYFLGSRALAREWSRFYGASRPDAALILDMVADADLAFRRETKAEQAAKWLNDRIWAVGGELNIPAFAVPGDSPIYDDQDALLEMGIPATLLIDYEYPWWHTLGDTLDKCAPAALAATGRVTLASMVDRPPVPPAPAPSAPAPAPAAP